MLPRDSGSSAVVDGFTRNQVRKGRNSYEFRDTGNRSGHASTENDHTEFSHNRLGELKKSSAFSAKSIGKSITKCVPYPCTLDTLGWTLETETSSGTVGVGESCGESFLSGRDGWDRSVGASNHPGMAEFNRRSNKSGWKA